MKILGYDYKVQLDGGYDVIGAFGRCHYSKQLFQIASDLCFEQETSTLLHEIIEALNYHLELGLAHSTIMSLECGLYQVFKDNKVDLLPLNELIERSNE